jgi:hypothetical protein
MYTDSGVLGSFDACAPWITQDDGTTVEDLTQAVISSDLDTFGGAWGQVFVCARASAWGWGCGPAICSASVLLQLGLRRPSQRASSCSSYS